MCVNRWDPYVFQSSYVIEILKHGGEVWGMNSLTKRFL